MPSQKIIIITAPSGAGKTSITRYLLSKFENLRFSISATTRPPRPYEQHGKDYYFLSLQQFQEHIKAGDFLEWEMVYEGKYYGTLRSEVFRMWQQHQVPLLDIDVKGAIHIQQQFARQCLSVFIEAPSLEALKSRLENRGTETPETIATRLNKASYEMSFKHHFNAVVVNDVLERACEEVAQLVADFFAQPS
ncbi:MAG TPA: guanylate kinase [Phnomibacter sp.]|nr:guanylate kinase [Phnomibacter sp.]